MSCLVLSCLDLTSFYESTPSAQDPMRNKISPGAPEDPGNVRTNIPDALKERDHRDISGYFRIRFKCIPGSQSVRTVASSNIFKTAQRSHLRTSLSHAHFNSVPSIVERGDYEFKNTSAGCVLSCTNTSRQQEVPTFAFENKVYQFVLLPFGLKNCPSGICSSGAQSCSLPPSSGDIGNPIHGGT